MTSAMPLFAQVAHAVGICIDPQRIADHAQGLVTEVRARVVGPVIEAHAVAVIAQRLTGCAGHAVHVRIARQRGIRWRCDLHDVISRDKSIELVGAIHGRGGTHRGTKRFTRIIAPVRSDVIGKCVKRDRDAVDPGFREILCAVAVEVVIDRVADRSRRREAKVGGQVAGGAGGKRRGLIDNTAAQCAGAGKVIVPERVVWKRRGIRIDRHAIRALGQVREQILAAGVRRGGHDVDVDAITIQVHLENDRDARNTRFGGRLGTIAVGVPPDRIADRAGANRLVGKVTGQVSSCQRERCSGCPWRHPGPWFARPKRAGCWYPLGRYSIR